MTESRIYYLLSRYADKEISKEELLELKELVNSSDNSLLGGMFEHLWCNFDYKDGEADKKELDKIYSGIQKKLKRKQINMFLYRTLKYAGIILIPLLFTLSLYFYQDRKKMYQLGQKEITIDVAKGQKAGITLPDGSRVYLNSESLLRYKQNFDYKDRKVDLMGEAFFEVKRDTTKPFIVYTKHLNIEVLGTTFNLYAYEQENTIEMALVSGYVKIETHTVPSEVMYVKSKEKILFDKISGKLHLEKTNTLFETAWMRNELVFRSEQIESVLTKVERKYGVKIHVDGKWIENDRFTGYFYSDHVGDVMEILRMHYKFEYRMKNDEIWIITAN
ncbi:FecR family protein [Dysgonomonas sp. Marseille-P4677]|uniref:FecR family protein n=1 Tax=Dysgonomonas sp. Marseille-P4677 TaxID=2364790 RepID=UPI0019148537|nr:FecR family protein [Dysgonomonas sp. Marseille-P4677]MBK5720280.1 FecR family protein [Dysgonomonas sp. Marseille-P4677]